MGADREDLACPHCRSGEPSVWDDVLSHYAHPSGGKLKVCHSPWRDRCRHCSADIIHPGARFCGAACSQLHEMGSQAVVGALGAPHAASVQPMAPDPTTAAIAAQISDRDQLRAEVDRLSKALVAAYTDVEVLTAAADATFVKGYDQAVQEIHAHFAKSGQHGEAHEIDVHFRKRGIS